MYRILPPVPSESNKRTACAAHGPAAYEVPDVHVTLLESSSSVPAPPSSAEVRDEPGDDSVLEDPKSPSHGAWSPWTARRWLVENDPMFTARSDPKKCIRKIARETARAARSFLSQAVRRGKNRACGWFWTVVRGCRGLWSGRRAVGHWLISVPDALKKKGGPNRRAPGANVAIASA